MSKLPPQHQAKREAALRANLMKRKEQARAREDVENSEKTLPMEKQEVKDKA